MQLSNLIPAAILATALITPVSADTPEDIVDVCGALLGSNNDPNDFVSHYLSWFVAGYQDAVLDSLREDGRTCVDGRFDESRFCVAIKSHVFKGGGAGGNSFKHAKDVINEAFPCGTS